MSGQGTEAAPEGSRPITTLLLDADGVVQSNRNFRRDMGALLGERVTFEQLFAVERPTLTGGRDLRADLGVFIAEHGLDTTPDAMLDVWLTTTPDPEVLAMVDQVRAAGVPVYLATNQQPIRGRFMQAELGYGDRFDGQFHSWELGVAKPDPEFFRRIVGELGVDPAATLFVDDLEPNVLGAREVGLVAEHHDRETGAEGVRGILTRHGLLA